MNNPVAFHIRINQYISDKKGSAKVMSAEMKPPTDQARNIVKRCTPNAAIESTM